MGAGIETSPQERMCLRVSSRRVLGDGQEGLLLRTDDPAVGGHEHDGRFGAKTQVAAARNLRAMRREHLVDERGRGVCQRQGLITEVLSKALGGLLEFRRVFVGAIQHRVDRKRRGRAADEGSHQGLGVPTGDDIGRAELREVPDEGRGAELGTTHQGHAILRKRMRAGHFSGISGFGMGDEDQGTSRLLGNDTLEVLGHG